MTIPSRFQDYHVVATPNNMDIFCALRVDWNLERSFLISEYIFLSLEVLSPTNIIGNGDLNGLLWPCTRVLIFDQQHAYTFTYNMKMQLEIPLHKCLYESVAGMCIFYRRQKIEHPTVLELFGHFLTSWEDGPQASSHNPLLEVHLVLIHLEFCLLFHLFAETERKINVVATSI